MVAENREPLLRTLGVIARELGHPLHRVQYILNTRTHIRPAARAGRVRLFDIAAVEAIRVEIERIDARAEGGRR